MTTDLTFITNEEGKNLKDRFNILVKDTRFFDVLVGYFYTSGFYAIYPQLEKTEKIRILIGISTNQQTYNLLQKIQSHKEINEEVGNKVVSEMDECENNFRIEEGVYKFLEWLKSGKLEIKAYPEEKIHSKLYIMTFEEDDRDIGRVITGSSNFTRSGLIDNLEFNVELKNPSDYKYAKEKFDELWKKGIDVSEKYIEAITENTWLKENITPYELYLKFLYEYFKEEINEKDALEHSYRPDNFKELKYQDHAVINAKKIVEEYGGVFLSDVVGLGKTFMGTMLCEELPGRTLVLAPPHLIDESNEGSWENAFKNFGFRSKDYKCESIGMLEKIIKKELYKKFDIVLIDESHRFRTEDTETYAKLAQICRGKKVILVTATPYNNSPKDLLAQIKLFQRIKNSTIPNLPNIEGFFKKLERNLKGLDRKKDKTEYLEITKANSKLIREKVLKYLMVRRTRKEIQKYYGEDLKKQKMRFPDIADPQPVYYEFNKKEDQVFFKTIEIISKDFKYARYTPLLYRKGELGSEEQRQKNMRKFMKMMLIKRLESSFFAFNQSVDRFINSYQKFIEEYKSGSVYVSKKHIKKIFDYLESGNIDAIDLLISEEKVEKFPSKEFKEEFIKDLQKDLETLLKIKDLWKDIDRDPKIIAFKEKLADQEPLKAGKSIIFTESKETAQYLVKNLQDTFPDQILYFSGGSSQNEREIVMENFDANSKKIKNDYKFLITTDVLAEGANLHQANVVINYDIPWNPTRIMQRVGRINRVDTKHDKIYTYTFFPTEQSNEQIKLKELAEAKIQAFITLLGTDAKLLTEGEVPEGHSLFKRILSKEMIEGEDNENESELGYLQEIRKIRDDNPTLFEKIKKLPKKARTARKFEEVNSELLTYFRKGKLQKFFIVQSGTTSISSEIDFMEAAKKLVAKQNEKQSKLNKLFYEMLDKNLEMLKKVDEHDIDEYSSKRGSGDNAVRLSKILNAKEIKKYQGFTDNDEFYLKHVIDELDSGGIPKKITQKLYKKIQETPEIIQNPIKLLAILKTTLPSDFLQPTQNDIDKGINSKKEIILSEYFNAE
ncbi:MAG: phospholipase D-like domain-containing protein [Bacteroidales bacterium]|jgi:superfamily II DNA or RNA helicase|nr:phospholipase D-like domain-containing protein [Bacteroidales bacterium]